MDLWIRSQDKNKLIKCNDIAIRELLYNEIPKKEYYYEIVGYFDKETEYESLGFYKTKKRALEVLDDIQKNILNNAYITTRNGFEVIIDIKPNHLFVYVMPEK